MGLSMLTVIEIYTNSRDLEIQIVESGSKWGVWITRGPGHGFKVLLNTEKPIFENREAAIESVMGILRFTREKAAEELTNPGSFVSRYINPTNLPVSEMTNVLTEELLLRIETDLKKNGIASPYTYKDLQEEYRGQ